MKESVSFKTKPRILFVCTGNISRSPLAESILRQRLDEAGVEGVEVESAATFDQSGCERDRFMAAVAAKHGYDFGGTSRHLTLEMAEKADLIIGFSARHVGYIKELTEQPDKVRLFMDYCFGRLEEVEDPFFQTAYVYDRVFDVIEKGCARIVEKLIANTTDCAKNEIK